MNKKLLIILLTGCLCVPALTAQSAPAATLEITFTGIRNEEGRIAIGVNTRDEGWPRKPQIERNWPKSQVKNGTFKVTLENLEYGTYAISVLDDENSNLEMDMIFGIPKEGWGFSQNPPIKLSAPDFQDCVFRIDRPVQQITIELRYMKKSK
jgi:uncharacterized protein (DUF2141 family)